VNTGHSTGPFAAGTREVSLGISAGIGGIATVTWLYRNLFWEIFESLNKITTTLLDLKIHVGCLAAMVLQNRLASQGETCAMLGKECCFYVNQCGEIQNNIKQLLGKTRDLRERTAKGWLFWEGTWLSHFLEHLLVICWFCPSALILLTAF
jgi:hypothetical protein